MKSGLYQLNDAQHATVLAALRFYQQKGMGDPFNRSDDIHELATNGGEVFSSLDDAGIDELCESINHDGVDFGACVQIFGDDEDDPHVRTAKEQYHRDGEIEIDTPAVVSRGSDPGAYVMAWVWVDHEDAGVTPENVCRECGEPNDNGEGWDGLCGNCADRAEAEKGITA